MATVAKSDASLSWRGRISRLVEIELKAGSSRRVAPAPRRSKPTSTALPFQFHAKWSDVTLPIISIPAHVQSPQGTSASARSWPTRHHFHMEAFQRGQMTASVFLYIFGHLTGVGQRQRRIDSQRHLRVQAVS